jgi:putative membrane protein
MRNEIVLQEARFDPKLPTYWMLSTVIGLAFTVVGILLIPIALTFGWAFFQKRYEALECRLTERSLHIKRGVIFRSEKNIPLDKIQDIGMTEGPLLRRLGLASLAVETAGQSSPQGAADAGLVGVVDAPAFRDAILDQRDKVSASSGAREPAQPAPLDHEAEGTAQLLVRISESLERIEGLLERSSRG